MNEKVKRKGEYIVGSSSNVTNEKITDLMIEKLIDTESITYIDGVILSSREILERSQDNIDGKGIQIIRDIQTRIALLQSLTKPGLLEELEDDVKNELAFVKTQLIDIVNNAGFDVMQAGNSIHFAGYIQIIDRGTKKINVESKFVQKKHLLISGIDVYISERMFNVLLHMINSPDTSIDFIVGSIEYQFYIRLKRVLVELGLLKLVKILERKRTKKK
ncbi:hypothetical protein GW846_02615 [Candidatus Gracilibacteria bacterium]|nr:hypothetical protein [Candidatus Gracilibacteria bacterium]